MAKQVNLSKSKYLHGLQCPKLLWYEYNRKKEIPLPSSDTLEIFKQGQIVGELARQLFPGGTKIKWSYDAIEVSKRSLDELKARKPLYEAGFLYNNAYALVDILAPAGEDSWDLIEVKSSSSVKGEHYADAAFQKYICDGLGIKIRQCFIAHLNRDYVRRGKIELDKLFKKEDITAEAIEMVPRVEKEIEQMLKVIQGEEPQIKVGSHCGNCLLKDLCWDFLPQDHVFILRGNKKIAYDLMESGILKMQDIPADYELNEKHTIQVKSHLKKEAYVDKKAIKDFLKELEYPLYFLDFETIAPAIPVYDNTRPFEDVPFQYSLHVLEEKEAKPKHFSFLAPGNIDPRQKILEKLKEQLGDKGSILAYYAEYERKCLRYAVRTYPEFNRWYVEIKKRFIDLLDPFKNLSYYHPAQKGSASIKYVLPALTGITYEGMPIKDGAAARFEYMRVTFDKEIETSDRNGVRQALEKYCELDTLGMVEILKALYDII
jgi:hypothetical protein